MNSEKRASCFADLVRSVSGVYNNRIKKSCDVLFRNFGLNQFFYYKIGNTGQFTLLDSNVAWGEYAASRMLYEKDIYLRHPKNFRDGIILLKSDAQDGGVREMLTAGKDKFDIGVVLKIIQKNSEGVEVFGFSSIQSDEGNISMLLSELPLLRSFIGNFRNENQFLFSKLEDNQIDFARLIGPEIFNREVAIMPRVSDRQPFLRNRGGELTLAEKKITQLVLQGYSASQIAQLVFRSKRTVEHRLDKIKQKLNCHSRAELVQKGRELELLGYFCV